MKLIKTYLALSLPPPCDLAPWRHPNARRRQRHPSSPDRSGLGPDSVIDNVGHDPRSSYVERFWLGVLGPSSVVFLRRIANEFETNPSGFELPLMETAKDAGASG